MPRRCGHARYTDGCMVCHWCADPGPKGAAHRKVWGEPLLVRGRCRHLGQPTGRVVDCPSCQHTPAGQSRVKLKVFGCAVHGECTTHTPAPGLACCQARCPDFTPDAVLVNQGAAGIGDSLMGLLAVGGLKAADPGRQIAYAVSAGAAPFVSLFDGGYDSLERHRHDGGRDIPAAPGVLQLNNGYRRECDTAVATPRWQRYCDNAGAPSAVLPRVRGREALLAAGREYAGCVALAPFSTDPGRNYPLSSWRAVEHLLREAGRRVLLLDDRHGRLRDFKSEKLEGTPAATVAAALLNCSCLAGNDSGMAHLAGCLGVPTVALCGQWPGERVYGIYPSVRCLDGPVTPARVAGELDRLLSAGGVPTTIPGAFLIDPYLYPDDPWLRQEAPEGGIDLARRVYAEKHALALLLRPVKVLEIGVRYGYSAAAFLAAGAETYLGIDADAGGHGGVPGAAAWAVASLRRHFPAARVEVRVLDTRDVNTLPDPFPGGRWDLIHVDGDHTEAGCLHDLELAWAARPNFILVDDVAHLPEVGRAVKTFLGRHWPPHVTLATVRGDVLIQPPGDTAGPAGGKLAMLAATKAFRDVPPATLEEQRRHLTEDSYLYEPGRHRYVCSLLGALYEELAGREDLRALVLEATYMARMIHKHHRQEDAAWDDEYVLGGGA
jgi:hypothetical protein